MRDLPLTDQPLYRLRVEGTKGLSNLELLAALLQTPDALALAQELLVTFGGLASLSRASVEELQCVHGIGPARAAQLHAAFALGLRLLAACGEERPQIRTPGDVAALLQAEMGLLPQEELRAVLLDTRNRLCRIVTIYIGSLNTVVVRMGELFREAIRLNCASLILVHNHPSAEPSPSPEDILVTRHAVETGHLLDIEVLDHIILAGNRFVSLKEQGQGFK
jgi:DNA repair protein RadC